MTTLSEIQAKIQKLQAQAEEIAKRQSSVVMGKIRDLMEKHGLTPADVESYFHGPKRVSRKAGSPEVNSRSGGAPKYRDPETGATWTGHGRAPAWIANAKDRSKFLVVGDRAVTTSPAKKEPKAGNYVRGRQEPKYRDPQSGATWSGRGKAPAWLASAKDRSAFLIDASGAATSESTKPAAKKATAKKATAKKAATKKAATKKAATKTETLRKTATKKVAAKKGAAKSASAKKAPAQAALTGASEASATTTPVKKAAAKKALAKKGSARKVAAKKVPQALESAPLAPAPQAEAGEADTSASE
ncbi:hypothetical protein CR51_40970 [Caballeronia megalochromosomata]|nr:hypothetical protein CR51_40970 [Caballeronia megalochromosomata]